MLVYVTNQVSSFCLLLRLAISSWHDDHHLEIRTVPSRDIIPKIG